MPAMEFTNFVRDIAAELPPDHVALIERRHDGGRLTHTVSPLVDRARRLAGTFARLGVRRGDVVLTLIGSRLEWVETMLACFTAGYVVLPCSEQLRVHDLRQRLQVTRPSLIVADERNRTVVEEAQPECTVVLVVPDASVYDAAPAPYADLAPTDPCLLTMTSGTSGPPKAVLHGQRYLMGQGLQAEHWLGARPNDVVWCTAGTGWSKSARNSFIAAWLRGATALLHDARFDPDERLAIVRAENVNVWCMAPTEYRVIAARSDIPQLPMIRALVAAGEPLDERTLEAWREATGVDVRDGYGQTETGQTTANPVGQPARPGSMGKALPGVSAWIDDGELVLDPSTVPTFFLGYLGEDGPAGPWRTGDRVHQDEDGYLYFDTRADDVIISAGYRIGPYDVESVLGGHPAVAECAVVGAPDPQRGQVVRAVVVLKDGYTGSDALVHDLQEHVKAQTAPYKYPRIVEFTDELPRTVTGKISRSSLRSSL
jgi:acyl-coenzyme A synthetase/AMP-(fatty) acid ligase